MAVVDLAWQTTAAVAPEDVWKTLSRGTADEHGKLDASLSALPLHTDAGTAAFIAAMAAAVPGVEAALSSAATGTPLAPWAARGRADTLPDAPAKSVEIDSEAAGWGAAYVLEGSRLGGRLLHRRYALLARQPFFRDATLPSVWAAFLNDLRDADERLCDRAAMLTGALTAFRAFTDAIEPGSELPQR